ncbi:hypothetical protein MC885_003812, partial [Smutsia gigantea]
MLAPKAPPPTPEDISMEEENLCQAFSDSWLYKIEDIDHEDWENPQLCSSSIHQSTFLRWKRVNGHMCVILVDGLVQVHSKFRLLQETLYMCIAIMDRVLQVGVTSQTVCQQLTEHRIYAAP